MVVSALLLLAVVITVHNDVKYRTLHPNTATAELLGVAPAAAAPKTATTAAATSVGSKVALKASNLQAKLAAVDVGGDLSPAVVQKLADKMVRDPCPSCFLFARLTLQKLQQKQIECKAAARFSIGILTWQSPRRVFWPDVGSKRHPASLPASLSLQTYLPPSPLPSRPPSIRLLAVCR